MNNVAEPASFRPSPARDPRSGASASHASSVRTEMNWRLEVRALSVRRGDRLVLQDVNFSVGPGECLSIVGPNGSGKTTLLLALLGLLAPAAGAVTLNGVGVRRMPARQRGRWLGYVPQTLTSPPPFYVYDVVADGRFPYVSGVARLTSADLDAVHGALERCGLLALADRVFTSLSGGEQRRTLLAAAMAQDPQVLLLDEPNTALDPAYRLELVRILLSWLAGGRSLVVVSHDLDLPAALGGCVLALRGGRVVAAGPADVVLAPETLTRVYEAPFELVTSADGRRFSVPRWWTYTAGCEDVNGPRAGSQRQ